MPRRRDKRTDTENSDDFDEREKNDRVVHFGTMQFNRMLAPDQIEGDDTSKYSIRAWSNTLLAQRLLPWPERKLLFSRALECLPFSYKIWEMFLHEFSDYCAGRPLISREYAELNQLFEAALTKLSRMPRIWLMYAEVLSKQHLITRARAVFNWSFRNLPLTQHEKIWHKFALWAMKLDNSATAISVIPRYIKLNPDFKDQYYDYLKGRGLFNLAAGVIKAILADEGFHGGSGRSHRDFYFELVDLLALHPSAIKCAGDGDIRLGVAKYPAESGLLWVKLSDYFIRLGQFEQARQVLEEALGSIDNAKDFGIIFNAYCKFEQEMITALASVEVRAEYAVVQEDNVDHEIEVRLKRLEQLIERQPFLLFKINLRKNPSKVKAWLGLIAMYKRKGQVKEALQTVEEAIRTIQPQKVDEGRLSEVWIEAAKIWQSQNNLQRSNQTLFAAARVNYKMVQDYVNVWVYWIEMLLAEGYLDDALKVVKHVLFRKKDAGRETDPNGEVLRIKNIQELLKSNASLWQLYIDLECNLGNFDTVKTAYERCKEHKCLTPIMLLNYTNFLWGNSYFEETFRVFQFAVGNFKWPSLYQIWIDYAVKFVKRYGNAAVGVQRARSMFQRLIGDAPAQHAKIFYFMYAEFEEDHGLYSHAVEIYDRMVNAVPKEQKLEAYSLYAAKVAKLLGITKTRTIFETALQKLTEKEILKIGRTYALLETHLGEIERARAVYTYINQFTDPRDDSDRLWKTWEQLEVDFGDKETFKEYLRIKRSVEAKYEMLPPDLEKIEARVEQGLL